MSYHVHEAFYSIQGEGARAGRAAVFCRFSGCNLWSGREDDREQSPCPACDTDFVGTGGDGGGVFAEAHDLAAHLAAFRPEGERSGYLVLTGGEPTLQADAALIAACHAAGFEVAIETNGTRRVPDGLDWVCVSPKPGAALSVTRGDELKLLYPSKLDPADFENLDFAHLFLQPLDTGDPMQTAANQWAALEYCLSHPRWRLSIQLHKILGVR